MDTTTTRAQELKTSDRGDAPTEPPLITAFVVLLSVLVVGVGGNALAHHFGW